MSIGRSHRFLSPEAWRAVFPWIAVALCVVVLAAYAFVGYAVYTYGGAARLASSDIAILGVVVFGTIAATSFACALLIGFARPENFVARLCFYTFALAGMQFVLSALDPVRPFFVHEWERIAVGILAAPGPVAEGVVYHFFLRFPSGARMPRGWEALKYVFYVGGAAFVVPNIVVYTRLAKTGQYGIDFAYNNNAIFPGYFLLYRGGVVAALVCGFLALVHRYKCDANEDERRRLKWVAYGTAIALVPYTGMHIADFISVGLTGRSLIADPRFLPYAFAIIALLGLIPATFGYTILKHRVFDVNVAARLGVRYIFAKGVLEAVLALPIVIHVVRILTHPNSTVGEILYGSPITITLVVLAVVCLGLRGRLRALVAKRYFRDPYDSERILVTLVDEIKDHDSMSELSRRVSAELETALHPRSLAILYREEDARELTVGYASGEHNNIDKLHLSGDSELVRLLDGENRARAIGDSGGALPDGERELLRGSGFELVVPMTGTDRRLCGVLLLGPKRSEAGYSRRDRALLESVAAQMAIVYENSLLKSRVARERKIRVEVLGRVDRDAVNLVKECPRCGRCFDSTDVVCSADGAELSLSLPVERVVEGKYRLDRLVGRGGMGAVYAGTDVRLNRGVAVKILTGQLFGDQGALRRFEREAQASARLSHTNIVRVYDYGAVGDAGAFLVMELLHGRTLRGDFVRSGGGLEATEAARLLDQTMEGVAAAHVAGVVHRDLKPENVFIAVDEAGTETVKLLDFGLAKLRRVEESEASGLTTPGAVMGTFGYMSPEQLAGAEIDERTDIFALGVIAYEALVGRKPYEARTWIDLIAATTLGDVRVPGHTSDARALERVLRRALAGSPGDRYRSVDDLRRDLGPAMRGYSGAGRRTAPADSLPTKLYGDEK